MELNGKYRQQDLLNKFHRMLKMFTHNILRCKNGIERCILSI